MKKFSITYILLILMCITPASAQDKTIDIYISGSYILDFFEDDEEETTDWFFSATDDSGKYNVRLDYLTDYDGKYGTYTLDDIDRDYSYIKDYSTGELEFRNYLEGTTFTITEINGLLHIDGTLVCDDGVTYKLHVDHIPQTFNIEGTELTDISYFTEDTDWYLRFVDSNYRITLDINTGDKDKFSGTYTQADAVAYYNFVTDLNTGSVNSFTKMNVTLSMPKGITDPSVACEITGTALSDHGDTYNFHMKKNSPITPIMTTDVDVDLLTAEWPSDREDCKSYFSLTERDNPSRQWNLALDALHGTLDESHFLESLTGCINTITGDTMRVDNGTVDITFDPSTTTVFVDAALVMTDSIEYRFSFEYIVESTGQASYAFHNLVVYDDHYDEVGTQWIDASDDNASIEVTLTSADIPGEYDESTASISMAVTGDDGETNAINDIAIFYATTTLDEHNQPVLTTKFLGNDKKIYTVDAHLQIPVPTDTVSISISGLKVNDFLESLSAFQIYGYNADSTIYVALTPEATKFTGHYTTKKLAKYRRYCMLAFLQNDGTYEQNDFYTADFDVFQNDQQITLSGYFQAGTHYIKMTLRGTIRPQGMDYDNEDEDVDVRFTSDDLVSLEKDENYGYAYVALQNASRNDIFTMLVYLNSFDDDTVIPAGTYEVNDTYRAPSVQPGEISDNTVYASFYGYVNSEGYLSTPLWFLTSGTVTVSKTSDNELQFQVNGYNSFGRSLHIIYNGEETGIDSLCGLEKTGARKILENGHIVIKQNGQKFSVVGQRLAN